MGKPVLDRKERYFLAGPPLPTAMDITALALEARRRKVSYGQLVADITKFERFEIMEAYKRGDGHGT